MRKIILSLALLFGFAAQALAADNYTATAGSGLTFAAKDNGSAVLFSRFIGCDNTTTTQCWAVDASGRLTVNLAAASTVRSVGNIGGVFDAIGQNVAAPANWIQIGCQFQTTPTTITATNGSPFQCDNAANALVNVKVSALPTGASTSANQTSELTKLDSIITNTGAPIPAGSAIIGKVGVDQTTPGTTNGVALVGVNGVTALAGAGAVGTGSPRVAVGQDTTTIAGAAPGTAGTASSNVLTVQGVASMTKLLVTPDSVALPANQSVNVAQIAGAATAVGSGVQATAQRITLATDSPGIVTLGSATAANSLPITVGPALLGSYCMGANSGTMAAGLAGGSPVFSFRYGAANLAIIRKITAEADDISTAFVAGAAKFDLIAARSFTASDTGGTAGTLTGNNGKLRTSFATTGVSDFRIASTATLTAGTRTLDAQPLASVEFAVPTSIDAGLLPTTDIFRPAIGESPLVLAQNEGFVLQATVPGTGTWVFSTRVCWDEVSAF